MKLFDKRPLSLILCIMLAVFVFFANTDKSYGVYIGLGISVIIIVLTFLTPKIFSSSKVIIRIAAILVIPTVIASSLYFNLYFKAEERFCEQRVEITGYIHEIDKATDTSTDTAIIKATDINGESFSRYSLIAYLDKSESVNLTPGAELRLTGILEKPTSTATYGRGISAVITEIDNISVTGYRNLSLTNIITDYREWLCRYIVFESEDTYSGGLFAALLIGEQDYLEPGLKGEFKMIGISHILALSGMHLAIICLGLGKLLDAIGVNRKIRCVSVIVFTLVYMAFTGFSSSVTRSGIMLIISSLLYLLAHSHDSVTSLFISVAIIIIIEPYAIYDAALWLSAFATLGVLISYEGYSEYDKKKPIIIRILRYILMSLLSSLFAITATALLSHLYFGRISVLTPITSLLFGILSEVYMYLGIGSLIIAPLLVGIKPLLPLYTVISRLADMMSDIDYVYSYTTFIATEILIAITTVALLLFIVLDIKKRKLAAVILSSLLLVTYITSYLLTMLAPHANALIYNSTDTDDTFIAISDGEVAVINSKIYDTYTAYDTYELTEEYKLSQIDLYILPVYYWSATDMLSVTLYNTSVKRVVIPAPVNEYETEIMKNVSDLCEGRGVDFEIAAIDKAIQMNDFYYIPIARTPAGEKVQTYVYTMRLYDKFCTYISAGYMENKSTADAVKAFGGTHTLIFGAHGTQYTAGSEFYYEIPGISTIIFNSKNYTLDPFAADFYDSIGAKIKYNVTRVNVFE